MTHRCLDHCQRLASREVHVWSARLVDDLKVTADLLQVLDQGERERAAQFSFERDRVRFIQAHGMVRRIVARYCGADAAALAFARNTHGKPYLVPRSDRPALEFSLSHSGDCCMLALRLDHAVGVDVEHRRDLPQAMAIAQRYFTPAESAALAGLPEPARSEAFLLLWTHKEAMVKALGVGLPANLDRVAFTLDAAGVSRLAAVDGDRSIAQRWDVRCLNPASEYIAAIASMRPIESLTLRHWSHTDVE
jgi:4'-phosphopantetheinyl transferase